MSISPASLIAMRRILGVLVAGLLSLTNAVAQQVVSYVTAVPALAVTPAAASNPVTLQVPAFNAALGNLTQVKLSYTSTAHQIVQGENQGGAPIAFNYSLKTTLKLAQASGGISFEAVSNRLAGAGRAAAFDGSRDFSGASGFKFDQFVSRTETRLETALSVLSDFTGEGSIDFLASALADLTTEGAGDLLVQADSDAGMRLEVEYTFTAIPEPETHALMIGLAGFGLVLLRRGESAKRRAA